MENLPTVELNFKQSVIYFDDPKKMYIIFRYKFTGFFYKLRTFRNIPNSSNYEILALRGC